eukprot:scaffold307051_cov17-Prasinocladus_malaysianus.AAC.2
MCRTAGGVTALSGLLLVRPQHNASPCHAVQLSDHNSFSADGAFVIARVRIIVLPAASYPQTI